MLQLQFLHKVRRKAKHTAPQHVRIQGVAAAPITAEPDDAELAAAALLASLCSEKGKGDAKEDVLPESQTEGYYDAIAGRIRQGRAIEERAAMRRVSYCEQELQHPRISDEKLSELNRIIFSCQNAAERNGEELLMRWQKCLAQVTVTQQKNH